MKAQFYKGVLRHADGRKMAAHWSLTEAGTFIHTEAKLFLNDFGSWTIESSRIITELDLPGLDEEHLAIIISNILKRKYLDRPGVESKGDALLFVLVNEALHELHRNESD